MNIDISMRKSKRELEKNIRLHRNAILMVNVSSRKGNQLLLEAKRLLKQRGFRIIETLLVRDTTSIDTAMTRVMRSAPDLLILASGDGTVSTVVDHLAYTNTVLGFIPLGTTNNFARSLSIPLDVEGAIDVIANGKVADIDLGKVNEDYYANVASIGITVAIARSVSNKYKRWLGRFAYVLSGLKMLFRHRSFSVTIDANDRSYAFKTHELLIVNGRFHAGRLIASDASIDNQSLVLFYLGDVRKLELLRSLLLHAFRRPRTLNQENYIVTDRATITTYPPQRLELDGELRETTPVEVSVAPEALLIMVGKDFNDD